MRGLVSYLPFTATVAVIGILSMFLPPFGMLIAKWAALEAAASHPVVMVLIVLGSTFSLVFWTKWMGRMLGTRPTNKKPKLESMHPLFRIPLATLTALVIALSLSVTQVVKYVVEPTVARVFKATGMTVTPGEAFPGGLVGDSGMFPIIIVTTVIGLSVIIPALLLRNRSVSPNSVYMCGEQSADETTLSFLSAADEPYEISVGFYYFDKIFGEGTHLRWMNTVAAVLMIAMVARGLMS
jgi:ech hydrogenase subunit A